jgi:hypothetical protein
MGLHLSVAAAILLLLLLLLWWCQLCKEAPDDLGCQQQGFLVVWLLAQVCI